MEQTTEVQQQLDGYTIPLTAEQIAERLKMVPSLSLFCQEVTHSSDNGGTIVLDVASEIEIKTGLAIKFRSPETCSKVTRLAVRRKTADELGYVDRKLFAFADANGNDVSKVDNLFQENAIVHVILDLGIDKSNFIGSGNTEIAGAAFVQNADTNRYLEGKFDTFAEKTVTDEIKTRIDELETELDSKSLIKIINWGPHDTWEDLE